EKLSLSGKAKLVNLWKGNGNDWHGNYYLTSKDDSDNKLSIKYGDANWSIDLTDGLFVQDLLPDSVKIYVTKTPSHNFTNSNDYASSSNFEAYRNRINTESTNSKYKIEGEKLYLKVDGKPDILLNPIKIPHLDAGYHNNVLFKAEYIFDGTGMFNGDIFGTKLKFKKAFKWEGADNTQKPALNSNTISNVWYGVNYIPNSDKDNPVKPNEPWDFAAASNLYEYFWKGKSSNRQTDDNDKGFENSIHGDVNSINGSGIDQMIENDHNEKNGQDLINKVNQEVGVGTNYLIYSRIAYRNGESNEQFGYLWSNTVTILYVEPKMNAQ
ncbi:hypothetical protein LNO75_03915, partial [Mycoplasma sp. T363T]|uniref:hypothetical protein n=1 Tax=Mycoplasma bradburyae TaxID=2963128 RepID=UPI002340CCC9